MAEVPSSKRSKTSRCDETHITGSGQDDTITTTKHPPYYHNNFKIILNTVLSGSDSGLLVQQELDFIQTLLRLPDNAQLLFVRLYLRKHRWLRLDKIIYLDIADDLDTSIRDLVNKQFLHDESKLLNINDCLDLLQVSELKSFCKELQLPSSVLTKQKQQIIDYIMKHCRQYKPMFTTLTPSQLVVKKCKSILGQCVLISSLSYEVFSRVILLFSLSFTEFDEDEENGLQALIFRILEVKTGKRVYPLYNIRITNPIFDNRENFERYYSAYLLLRKVNELLINKNICETIITEITSAAISGLKYDLDIIMTKHSTNTTDHSLITESYQFTAGWIYTTILTNCSSGWEKLRNYSKANELLKLLLGQDLFNQRKKGHWLERYTLNLDYHLGEKAKCLSVIKDSLNDMSLHVSRQLSLYQRAQKIIEQQTKKGRSKKTKTTITSDDLTMVPLQCYKQVNICGEQHPTSCLFITKDPNNSTVTLLPVEGYAVHYYTTVEEWTKAIHCEGCLFSTLFGLIMWNIIYSSDVVNVFRGSYQTVPLDFGGESFYNNRKAIIEKTLNTIKSSEIESIVQDVCYTYDAHYGELCPLVNWEMFSSEDVKELIYCLGSLLLYNICDIFSHNYRPNRGGLPDLVLWNMKKKTYKFVEVKGPGDRLSHKQIVWLSRLTEWGCEAEVCRVED